MEEIDELKAKLDKARHDLSLAEEELGRKRGIYNTAKSNLNDYAQKQADIEDFKKYNGKYWKIVSGRNGEADLPACGWYFHVDKFIPWRRMFESNDTLWRNEVRCKKALHFSTTYEEKTGIKFELMTNCLVKWYDNKKAPLS